MEAPEYPPEARAQGLTGSGVFILHVDPSNGRVTSVEVGKSTGQKILDEASLKKFANLRFKPNTVSREDTGDFYYIARDQQGSDAP